MKDRFEVAINESKLLLQFGDRVLAMSYPSPDDAMSVYYGILNETQRSVAGLRHVS